MDNRYTRFLWMTGLFLVFSAALLGSAVFVEDHMGMGYLMGLYTVCLFNAACLFGIRRTPGATARL